MNAPAPSPFPPHHFIVHKVQYKSGRVGISVMDKNQFEHWRKHHPDEVEGATCVKAISVAEAEHIAAEADFWTPIDPVEIAKVKAHYHEVKQAAKSHYPEAW